MDLTPLWISYDVRLQFHCSLILLEGEYSITCSWMLPNPFHPSNRPSKVKDSYFSSWSVFSQAKNSRDIKDQTVLILITIIKIYLGYYWFYLKRNAKKTYWTFVYSGIQIFPEKHNSFKILATPFLALQSSASNLICESHSFLIWKERKNTITFYECVKFRNICKWHDVRYILGAQ